MKRCVCAIHDSAINAFGSPIFVVAVGAALRSFIDEINRPAEGNALASHPDDFSLWHIAMYDDESGKFESLPDGLVRLARGKDVLTDA